MAAISSSGSKERDEKLTKSLSENLDLFKTIFKNDQTLIIRSLESSSDPMISYGIIYCDGMVNNKLLNEDIIRPLLEYKTEQKDPDLLDVISKQVTLSDSVEKTSDLDPLLQGIVYGDSVLLVDGYSEGLILNTKGWGSRSVSEPAYP